MGPMTGDKDPTEAHTLAERVKAQAEGTVGRGSDEHTPETQASLSHALQVCATCATSGFSLSPS